MIAGLRWLGMTPNLLIGIVSNSSGQMTNEADCEHRIWLFFMTAQAWPAQDDRHLCKQQTRKLQ